MGKTHLIANMMHEAALKGNPSVFIAHRRMLVDDLARRFDTDYHVPYSIVMAGRQRTDSLISICSLATLVRREAPRAKMIVLDEVDALEKQARTVIEREYPDAYKIGVSATPWDARGRGLSRTDWDAVVVAATYRELVAAGFLVEYTGRAFKPSVDLDGVRTKDGDFDPVELDKRVAKSHLTGNVVEEWARYAAGMATVVLPTSVRHSKELALAFTEARLHGGPIARFEHIDADTPDAVRTAVHARIRSGETSGVVSCDVLSRGVDWPCLTACVLARPSKSIRWLVQAEGRVLRPYDGKSLAWILDFGENIDRFKSVGLPDGPRNTALGEPAMTEEALRIGVTTCPQCWCAYSPSLTACPYCHEERPVKARKGPGTVDGVGIDIREAAKGGVPVWRESLSPAQKGWRTMIWKRGPAGAKVVAMMVGRKTGRMPGASEWEAACRDVACAKEAHHA